LIRITSLVERAKSACSFDFVPIINTYQKCFKSDHSLKSYKQIKCSILKAADLLHAYLHLPRTTFTWVTGNETVDYGFFFCFCFLLKDLKSRNNSIWRLIILYLKITLKLSYLQLLSNIRLYFIGFALTKINFY